MTTVTVVGANGTMGANISGIFASFGDARVFMVSRDIESSRRAARAAAQSVKADSIVKNLVPADYSMLADCVCESDLVFESVAEDLEIKLDVTRRIGDSLRDDAIACSGTSGLPITTLAEALPERLRSNYFGVHMYNPPYNMTLCEVTPTLYTNRVMFDVTRTYLTDVLGRTVVEVKDSPGFLGNRIGFYFINKALQYADQYKFSGGIDYIDAILGPFTGRTMAPLTTSDFVGLDVHRAIVDNIHTNTSDYARETFVFPEFAKQLVEVGRLGRKSNGGLYKMEVRDGGSKHLTVYDITMGTYRNKLDYGFPFAEEMVADLRVGDYSHAVETLVGNRSSEAQMCLTFLLEYVIYALSTSAEVGYDIHSADDVMATGFNWCPPLAVVEAIQLVADFKALARERLSESILDAVDLDRLLADGTRSKYDYRTYLRSAK